MTNLIEFEHVKEELLLLLEEKKYRDIKNILSEMQEADIAEFLEEVDFESGMKIFRLLSKATAIDVFSYFESETQEKIIRSISDMEVKDLIEELSIDDAVDMLEEMPASIVKRVLKNANAGTRYTINRFLNYPEDAVGSIMTAEFTDIRGDMTVDEAIAYLRRVADNKETIYTCYIIGSSRVLEGVIELCDILACKNDCALISEIMETNVVKACTTDDRESVAGLFSKYDLHTLPVVDNENRLVGIVTVDDIVDVIEEETTKDIEQMAAILPTDDTYVKTSVFAHVKARIPWLFVLMIAGMFNGVILGKYELAISALPILVTFMPMLTGTGGNSGSQTTATVIRAMTLDEISLKDSFRVWWKEIRVALTIGIVFGALNFARIYFLSDDPDRVMIGVVLALSMIFTIFIAKSLGAVLPLLAKKFRLDPAVVASPMITTIVDVVSLMFYFNLAMVLLAHRI